jgi:hypothetical protein
MVQPLISCAALSPQRPGLLGDLPFEPNQFCNLTEPRQNGAVKQLDTSSLHFSQVCVARWWGPLPQGRGSIRPDSVRQAHLRLTVRREGRRSGTQSGQIRNNCHRMNGSCEGACGAARSTTAVAILLAIQMPETRPCDYAYSFKIHLR